MKRPVKTAAELFPVSCAIRDALDDNIQLSLQLEYEWAAS